MLHATSGSLWQDNGLLELGFNLPYHYYCYPHHITSGYNEGLATKCQEKKHLHNKYCSIHRGTMKTARCQKHNIGVCVSLDDVAQ